jgi:hypothetical protein
LIEFSAHSGFSVTNPIRPVQRFHGLFKPESDQNTQYDDADFREELAPGPDGLWLVHCHTSR